MMSIAQPAAALALPPPHPRFGRAIRVHRGRPLTLWRWWFYGALSLFCGVRALAGFVSSATEDTSTLRYGAFVLLTMAVTMFVITGIRGAQRVVAHEGGFVWWRPVLGTREVAWREIRHSTFTRHYSRNGNYQTLDLELSSGKIVTLHSVLEDLQAIGTYSHSPLSTPQAGAFAQLLRSGGTTPLGALTLTPAGILWRGSSLAWGQIADAGMHGHDVFIDTLGPPPHRVVVPAGEVGFPDVLLGVIAMSRGSC